MNETWHRVSFLSIFKFVPIRDRALYPNGDDIEIINIHLRPVKIHWIHWVNLNHTCRDITHLWLKGMQACSNEGPHFPPSPFLQEKIQKVQVGPNSSSKEDMFHSKIDKDKPIQYQRSTNHLSVTFTKYRLLYSCTNGNDV